MPRHHQVKHSHQITGSPATEVWHSPTGDPEKLTVLSPRRDMKRVRLGRIQRRNLNLSAKCQLCEVDRHKHHQVVALSLELLVLLNSNKHVQITTLAGASRVNLSWRGLTLTRQTNGLTVMNPRRDSN